MEILKGFSVIEQRVVLLNELFNDIKRRALYTQYLLLSSEARIFLDTQWLF